MLPDPEATLDAVALKRRLVARDWQEAITFGFVSSALEAVLFPERAAADAPITVLNPIASHLDVMRTTLAGGLIDVLRTNLARQHERVRMFEIGRCFRRNGAEADQPLRLGGLAYGHAFPEQWGIAKRPVDFHDVKGDLEALVAPRTLATGPRPIRCCTPAARRGSRSTARRSAGWASFIRASLKHFELARAPVVFELDLSPLLRHPIPVARPVSKLPVVRRDFAVVVDETVPASACWTPRGRGPAAGDRMRPFDLYRGAGLPPGKKSLAILVLMQDTERTLTDADIDATVAALIQTNRFGGSLRS